MRIDAFDPGLIAWTTTPYARCGVERWLVKTAKDIDADIATGPQPGSITALTQIAAPPDPDARPNSRFAPSLPVALLGQPPAQAPVSESAYERELQRLQGL